MTAYERTCIIYITSLEMHAPYRTYIQLFDYGAAGKGALTRQVISYTLLTCKAKLTYAQPCKNGCFIRHKFAVYEQVVG